MPNRIRRYNQPLPPPPCPPRPPMGDTRHTSIAGKAPTPRPPSGLNPVARLLASLTTLSGSSSRWKHHPSQHGMLAVHSEVLY